MDEFTSRHLLGVSRTYAILIPMLPGELAESVGLAYLLMRIVDTIEDCTTISTEERLHRFALLEGVLDDHQREVPQMLCEPIGDTEKEVALMRETAECVRRLRALPPAYRDAAYDCAREMMKGVREFVARADGRGRPYPAVDTVEEMRSYCYYVAGVVGVMLNGMMAHYLNKPSLRELRELSIELGVGLQLVNVLKDAMTDAKNNRRYLPACDDTTRESVYRAALAEARDSLERGVQFVLALPASARELRSFCGLPIAWGAMTLANADRDASSAKVGRNEIQASIARFGELVGDNDALQDWLQSLLRPEAETVSR